MIAAAPPAHTSATSEKGAKTAEFRGLSETTERIPENETPDERWQRMLGYAWDEMEREDIILEAERHMEFIYHRLRALAKRRGWKCDNLSDASEVAHYLSKELDDSNIEWLFNAAHSLVIDYFDVYRRFDLAQHEIERVRSLLPALQNVE